MCGGYKLAEIAELKLPQLYFAATNLSLDLRGKSFAIQGGNLSLIRVSEVLFLVGD